MDTDSHDPTTTKLCVLFADIVGSTRLYETLGDREASRIVGLCLQEMAKATQFFHGMVVETIGDEILSTFPNPAAAALAAGAMMRQVERLPPVGNAAPTLRIGIHFGSVLRKNHKIFGDTVNTAARIVSLARARQVLASKTSVNLMSANLRSATRELSAFSLKGKSEAMEICEVLWEDETSDLTLQVDRQKEKEPAKHRLLLNFDPEHPATPDRLYVLDTCQSPLTLGRDGENRIIVDNPRVSRRHARIELRQDKFVIADSSTNGTWVLFEGEGEIPLHHEESVLYGHGIISLGHPYRHVEQTSSLRFAVETG